VSSEERRTYRFQFVDPFEYGVVAIGCFVQREPIPLGTGFYVADGVVATAAHLFGDLDGHSDLFVMQRSHNGHFDCHPAEGRPSTNPYHDVAAFRVSFNGCETCELHPVLSIMGLEPEINEISGAFGYPMTSIEIDEEAGHVITTLNVTYSAGRILDVTGEPVPHIPGGAFITNFAIDRGGSGGPVFNSNGFVTAVYSRGVDVDPHGEVEPYSSVVAIRHVLDLSLIDETGALTNVGGLVRSHPGWRNRGPNVRYWREQH
jgi:hypothetical protein